MVMKSIVWIFGCSLMFAATMIIGLSLHSCKSKKMVESTIVVDSAGKSLHYAMDDSLFFEEFLRRHQRNLEFSLTWYRPVLDSSGNVTGSVPDKQLAMNVNEDSTFHQFKGKASRHAEADSTDVEVDRKEKAEEKPPPSDHDILILVVLALFVFFWINK